MARLRRHPRAFTLSPRLPSERSALLWLVSHFFPLRIREILLPHLSLPVWPPLRAGAGGGGAGSPQDKRSAALTSFQSQARGRWAGREARSPPGQPWE